MRLNFLHGLIQYSIKCMPHSDNMQAAAEQKFNETLKPAVWDRLNILSVRLPHVA